MRPVRMADNLPTFMCRLSRNLGASTSWNPLGLSRPVTGRTTLPFTILRYITIYYKIISFKTNSSISLPFTIYRPNAGTF
jgi:hypothetical protein